MPAPLPTHTVCEIAMLNSYSGGVPAKALQQLQEIKCLRLHAVKCLCRLYVQAGGCTCMLKSAYHPLLWQKRQELHCLYPLASLLGNGWYKYQYILMEQSSQQWEDREGETETDTYCSASWSQVIDRCVDVSRNDQADYVIHGSCGMSLCVRL